MRVLRGAWLHILNMWPMCETVDQQVEWGWFISVLGDEPDVPRS